jgi:hypothetical protein
VPFISLYVYGVRENGLSIKCSPTGGLLATFGPRPFVTNYLLICYQLVSTFSFILFTPKNLKNGS